jgi:ABC-type sugar transport system ATPase subunit
MLALSHVSKSFPGVRALHGVSLAVAAGEIHALVGENGAGKSTLTKIIAGVHQPDEGQIEFNGDILHWTSPGKAKRRGIHVIYQELVLFQNLSVAENIFIGYERRGFLGAVDHGRTVEDARELLAHLGVDLDPRRRVGELTVADQQMVEIAKAMVHNVRLLILDEPTSVISGRQVTLLFDRLRALRRDGVAIIYISHRLDEIFTLCDTVTVLKDGQLVGTRPVGEFDRDGLIAMMVGRDMAHLSPPKRPAMADRPEALRAESVSVPGRVRSASIVLHVGEIVGLAGLVGAGRTELALAIFGALPMSSGTLFIDGRRFGTMTPARAVALGIGLVTEDRKGQGLAMLLDVAANISASRLDEFTHAGLLDRAGERAVAAQQIGAYQIACRGPATPVATMSGGNQQKVVVARWARTCRKVLILDEPTRGVDVGAKQEIYRIIHELADAGIAILMISSELPEVVGLAERVVVMREGQITGELTGAAISEEAIMRLAAHEAAA